MTLSVYPNDPSFKNSSERVVFETIRDSLGPDDAIFANLQFTDPQHGDIEIDVLILMKDYGAIVVETKGGHITFDGANWIQSDPSGSRVIWPQSQAPKNMYSVRDYIRNKWSMGNLRTSWVVVFPHSHVPDVQSPELPKSRIIDKGELPHAISKMKSLLSSQTTFALPTFSGWVQVAVDQLMPISMMDASPSSVLGNNYEFIRELTHSRKTILDMSADNPRIHVSGPAGSGKTWLAFEQAKRWTSQGLKVGVLAFNRGIVSYLNRRAAEIQEGEKPFFVGTFHGLARSIGSDAGSPSQYEANEDLYRDLMVAKASEISEDEKYDAWVIDEAQDFLAGWWEVLALMLRDPENGQMAVFGDDRQSVYSNGAKPLGHYARVKLMENIRNSQQIAAAVNQFVERQVVARGPSSFELEFVECTVGEAVSMADNIVERLTDKEFWHPGEIALLTTMHRHPVQEELADSDIDAYWESLWTTQDVFYCTVGGFKGLERPVVVLAVDGFHSDGNIDDYLYTGMTRARDKLIVVAEPAIVARLRGL